MRIFLLTIVMLGGMSTWASAQSDAFVNQIRGNAWLTTGHAVSSSDVFVQQMPEESRIKKPGSGSVSSVYVPKVYVEVRAVSEDEPDAVIIYDDVGLVPYGETKRPDLPAVGMGTTVILRRPETEPALPNIGAGAVRL